MGHRVSIRPQNQMQSMGKLSFWCFLISTRYSSLIKCMASLWAKYCWVCPAHDLINTWSCPTSSRQGWLLVWGPAPSKTVKRPFSTDNIIFLSLPQDTNNSTTSDNESDSYSSYVIVCADWRPQPRFQDCAPAGARAMTVTHVADRIQDVIAHGRNASLTLCYRSHEQRNIGLTDFDARVKVHQIAPAVFTWQAQAMHMWVCPKSQREYADKRWLTQRIVHRSLISLEFE